MKALSEPRAAWHPPRLDGKPPEAVEPPLDQDADTRLQRLHEAAWDEGYADGLREGREAGLQQAAELVTQLQGLWSSMAAPYQGQTARLAAELDALVRALVTAVVRAESCSNPRLIDAVVPEVLEQLEGSSGEVEVFLNPEDRARVADLLTARSPRVHLRDDPAITRGGCRVDAPGWFLDATLEQRLADTLAAVVDVESETSSGGTL